MIKWPGLRVILKRTYPVDSLESLIRPWSVYPIAILHGTAGYWDWHHLSVSPAKSGLDGQYGDHTGVEFVNNRATGIILHNPCTCKSIYLLDGWCLTVKRHEVRRNVA